MLETVIAAKTMIILISESFLELLHVINKQIFPAAAAQEQATYNPEDGCICGPAQKTSLVKWAIIVFMIHIPKWSKLCSVLQGESALQNSLQIGFDL